MSLQVPAELARHPDRLRWNERYRGGCDVSFAPRPLAALALALAPPAGPALELAAGASGTALHLAAGGRRVTAVDISDDGLALLAAEARRRGVADLITLVQADLGAWQPPAQYALVLCTGFWDRAVFARAAGAVAAGGVLGWEAYTLAARPGRPSLPEQWCLGQGEPASLLPPGFAVTSQDDVRETRRRMLARRGQLTRSAAAIAVPTARATGGGNALPTCR